MVNVRLIPHPQPTIRLLRVNNAARLLGVAPRTIRQWAEMGRLPAHKCGPKLWFFYESDLIAFLTSSAGRSADAISGVSGGTGVRWGEM